MDCIVHGVTEGRTWLNNFHFMDMQADSTLIPESEEELKRLLIRVQQESDKPGLKLNIHKKNNVMASGTITSG